MSKYKYYQSPAHARTEIVAWVLRINRGRYLPCAARLYPSIPLPCYSVVAASHQGCGGIVIGLLVRKHWQYIYQKKVSKGHIVPVFIIAKYNQIADE